MLSLAGFTYVFFAENYCSGVPFSTVNADGSFTFGGPLTRQQVLDTAITRFNPALAAANALDTSTAGRKTTRTNRISLAAVGQRRALLDAGQFHAADPAATGVATTLKHLIQHALH